MKMQSVDEFQKVIGRKNKRKLKFNINKESSKNLNAEANITTDNLIRSLLAAVVDLQKSPFNESIFNILSESLRILNSNVLVEVICYGLGSFSKYRSSKYQLATLVLIKNHYCCKVSVSDPVFSETEVEVLKALGLNVIEENEEGKRVVTNSLPTLIFMPHCPSHLLNNFLFSNWSSQLTNCVIFCNSWSEIVEQNPLAFLKNETNYISRINPHVVEIETESDVEFMEIFNSTSSHIFPKLFEAAKDFWLPNEEPIYPIESTEFIRK